MWDRRVVVKIKECVGEDQFSKINFLWLLRVFMALMPIVIGCFYETNWLD